MVDQKYSRFERLIGKNVGSVLIFRSSLKPRLLFFRPTFPVSSEKPFPFIAYRGGKK